MNKLPVLAAVAVLYVPLAVHATQPLVSDDPNVQGRGHWQLELGAQRTAWQPATGWQQEGDATLTYGLNDQTDVYLSPSYVHGGDSSSGWNDTEVGLKWRFVQYGPVSLALKPRLIL
ncbi:MAG: transporter, partial [Burkholderiaceae bacterium]|nr:transporter [Burkholderiaceae bacterium]